MSQVDWLGQQVGAPYIRRYRWVGLAAPCMVTFAFCGMVLVYLIGGPAFYTKVARSVVIEAWDYPFLDSAGLMSWLECTRRGVNVHIANPCDVLGRTNSYSPLWHQLAWTGLGPDNVMSVGVVTALGFLTALFLLPAARRWRDAILLGLAFLSPPVLFGIERGNPDLTIFCLAVVAAGISLQAGWKRGFAYGLVLLAGLLKQYPLVLFLLAVRESLARLVAVGVIAILLTAGYVALEAPNLIEAWQRIPTTEWVGTYLGAPMLQMGLTTLLPRRVALVPVTLIMQCGLVVAAMLLLWRTNLRQRVMALPSLEGVLLLAGAALMVGCFLAGMSIMYRAIFLLMVLPALLRFAGDSRSEATSRLLRVAPWLVLVLLWAWLVPLPVSGELYGPGWLAVYVMWQFAWWALMALLLAALFAQIWDSRAIRDFRGRLGWISGSYPVN